MKGTLVFDSLNDLIYLKCCARFVLHVRRLAADQGLISSEHCTPFGKGKMALDPNILIQLFSPLITSQRFMREQFGNPYTSLQCEDGTNIVFQDYMDFLFLRIGTEDITELQRSLGITITLVSYLCGPDASLLKKSSSLTNNLDKLLDSWAHLQSTEESVMIEAINQINVNQQLGSSLVKSLKSVTEKVSKQLGPRVHALLFLETNLLSWYSTKSSRNLGAEDLLFLILLCHKCNIRNRRRKVHEEVLKSRPSCSTKTFESSTSSELDSSLDFYSTQENCLEEGWDFIEHELLEGSLEDDSLLKYSILLKEDGNFVPHVVQIGIVQDGLYFILVSEAPNAPLITAAAAGLQYSIEFRNKSRDPTTDKVLFEQLENNTRKLQDLLKKGKNLVLRGELGTRWDRFKSGFQSYLKTKEIISVQIFPVLKTFREIFRTYFYIDDQNPSVEEGIKSQQPVDLVWKQIKTENDDFWGFLRLKTKAGGGVSSSKSNLLMESSENLSVNKYLEEFPGLVHFIYLDRVRHNVILPHVDFSKEETIKLTKSKIFGMVRFAREHMQQGHFSLMWKDSAFNYAYFLWFEDATGAPLRNHASSTPWEGYPLPGILCGDFYKRVVKECFPNTPSSQIRCVELFCIHLGLVTSSCVLEHSKRLATNIFDEFSGRIATFDLL